MSEHVTGNGQVWGFANPVRIEFGAGALARVADHIGGRRWALVTYDMELFHDAAEVIAKRAGRPIVAIDNIVTNPDFADLEQSCATYGRADPAPEVIVALGGGSMIDAAKVLAASGGAFETVRRHLVERAPLERATFPPIIAVPTTAGTGSEVTCWATVWDAANGHKHSLADPALYPQVAVVDPELTLAAPRGLTLATGLDALSHALESLWNVKDAFLGIKDITWADQGKLNRFVETNDAAYDVIRETAKVLNLDLSKMK